RAEQEANAFSPGNWVAAPSASLTGEVSAGRFTDLVDRWAGSTQMLATVRMVRLVDHNGRVLAESPERIPLPEDVMRQGLIMHRGRTVFRTFRLPAGRLRFITQQDTEDGRTVYYIQS